MVHVLFEIQTLMPTILFIDKNHGKTSTPKSEGSCIFWGTFDRCIGQHLGRQSINIPAAMLADTRSRVRRISAEYRPISRSSGVLLSLTYWSTDRSTVGRNSIRSVSTIYWWIVSWVSVRYQWCISQQSASPRVGQYIHRVMFYCWSSIGQQINQQSTAIASVARHQSIGELLVDYIWYVISGQYRSTIAIAFTLCFALCYKVPDVSWDTMDTNACYT